MHITFLEEYLISLEAKTDALLSAFLPTAEEGFALHDLLDAQFHSTFAQAISEMRAIDRELAELTTRIATFRTQNWVRRLGRHAQLMELDIKRWELVAKLKSAREQLQVSENRFRSNPGNFARTIQRYEEIGVRKEKRIQFERLRLLVTELRQLVLDFPLAHEQLGGDAEFLSTPPNFKGAADIPKVLAFLERASSRLPDFMHRLTFDHHAGRDAEQILAGLAGCAATDFRTASDSDHLRCVKVLFELLTPPKIDGQVADFGEGVRAAIKPAAFNYSESWLLFWVTLATLPERPAGPAANGATIHTQALAWCQAWRGQLARLELTTLQWYAPGHETIPCSILQLYDGETPDQRSDVLFMLDVDGVNRKYCSVAGIHFASKLSSTPASWHAIHASLEPVSASFPLLSSHRQRRRSCNGVPLLKTAATASERSPESPDFHQEPLATALTRCLTTQAADAFESVEFAIDWIEQAAQSVPPGLVILYHIGPKTDAFEAATARLQKLAESQGKHYQVH